MGYFMAFVCSSVTAIPFLIVAIILLVAVIVILKKLTPDFNRALQIREDSLVQSTKYSEEEIIKHLDFIITEALDEYALLELSPKHIYYINTKLEDTIITHLSEEVPKRLSKTLYTHLSFIYNSDYLGEYIGKRIYITVLNYVCNFNLQNEANTTTESMINTKTDIGNQLSE